MNFWSLCPFSGFYLIFKKNFIKYFLYQNRKKRVLTCKCWRGKRYQRRADMARDHRTSWRGARDHHVDATQDWGHVAGPRVARARHRWRTGRGHVAGGHACPRGSTRQMEGPRVSGPWFVDWGGNPNALPRPTFWSHFSSFFLPCGTMFPHGSNVQVTWRLHGRWIISRGVDRVDPNPRDRNHSTCMICTLSDHDRSAHWSPRGTTRSARSLSSQIVRSPSDGHKDPRSSSHLGDTWNALERSISIGWATLVDDVEPS